MHRIPTAAIGAAAILAMSTSLAFASAPIKGVVIKGGQNPHLTAGQLGHRVIVTLQLDSTSSWAYDPATGGLNQLPTPEEQSKPIGGIGIVVKKNPGSSAARVTGDGNGGFALPTDLTPGNYDIVISVPAHAVNTKGTGSVRMAGATSTPEPSSKKHVSNIKWTPGKATVGATLTFHIIVGPTKSAAPHPKSTYLLQSSSSARSASTGASTTVQSITLDASRPPTVVVGNGTSSSQ